MRFEQHIGVLLLIIITCIIIWTRDYRYNKNDHLFTPVGCGIILFLIFEVIYWVISLL